MYRWKDIGSDSSTGRIRVSVYDRIPVPRVVSGSVARCLNVGWHSPAKRRTESRDSNSCTARTSGRSCANEAHLFLKPPTRQFQVMSRIKLAARLSSRTSHLDSTETSHL